MDTKQVKRIADTEVRAHEKRMHGMKSGGVTTQDMKRVGRNLARVANQRSGRRGG